MLSRHLSQSRQEAFRRRHDPHVGGDRLDDDAGDLVPVALEEEAHGLDVVVGRHERQFGVGWRHAGAIRQAQCGDTGAGAGQQAIGVAVVAPLELDDAVAAGEGAGEAQGGHGRLRARANEPHQLDRWHRIHHQPRQLHLQLRGRAEAGAALRRPLEDLDDGWVGVAQDQRPPGEDVVDVLVTVHVVDARAAAVGEGDRVAADGLEGADGAVHAAGHEPARRLEDLAGAFVLLSHRRT